LLQGVNAFIGSDYDDLMRGSGKNEQFGDLSDPSLGDDTYIGNGGYDTVVYSAKASAYTVTHKDGATFVEDRANGSVDRLESISQIHFADETLELQPAGNSNYSIYGSNGADKVDKQTLLPGGLYSRWSEYYALAGDDEIRWAHGNVYGGPGNDRIIGIEPNANALAHYGNSPGPVFISLKDGFALDGWGTRDVLININRVSPSWGYADTVIGSDGDDELWASGGGDLIDGGTGDDLVRYWNGDRRPLLISYKSIDSSYVVRWGARSTEQAVFKNIERFQEDLPGSSRTIELSQASLVNDQVFNTSNLAVGSRSTVVKGGEGSDQFYLADQQWAEPGAGYDLVRGVGNGVFGIRFDSSPAGVTVRADWGSVENDGFGHRDALQGVNAFFGSRFSDSIRGSGVDEFFGSANELSSGNDTYVGGGGFDVVRYVGNASDYRVITNATEGYTSVEHIQSRTIDRLEQIAQIQFKDSTQTLQSPAKGNKQHWGSEASDVISRNAFYNSDTGVRSDFYGGGGDDDIRWTNGNMIGGPGNDKLTISGNSDSGWVSYNDSPAGVYVDLQKGYALDGWGGRDSFINVSRVALSNHRDTVLGTPGNDEFWDSWGGDSIDGGAGNDTLYLWGGHASNYTLTWRDSESSWELRWQADDSGFMLLKNMEILEVNYPNGKARERIDLSSRNKVSAKDFTVNAEPKGAITNVLNTGPADDQISLSPGSWVISSSGYDTIVGKGYGSFGIRFDDSPKAVNVRADWGRVENDGWGFQDRLYGVNAFIGSPFNDYIRGQNTDEQFGDAWAFTKGNDTYVGGGGYDVVNYFGAASTYRVDYNSTQAKGTVTHLATGRTDTIEQISLIRFSDGDRTLITPGLIADEVFGSDAADNANKRDLLDSQYYRTWIHYDGGAGDDVIQWFRGDVAGGPGNDRISSIELGTDITVRYDNSPSGVLINLSEGYALDGWGNRDILTNISRVRVTGFRDTIIGSQGNDEFWDSWGGDTIDGAGGNDLFNFWIADKANYTISYDTKTDSYIIRWRSDPNGSITLKNIETLRENNNNNQSRLIQLKEIPKVSDIELDFAAPPSQASPASGVLSTPPSPVEGGPGSDFIQIVANQWIEASSGFDYYRGIGQGLFGLSFGKSPKGVVVRSDWGRVENDGWGQQDRLEGINAFFGSPHSDEIRGSNLDGNDSYWGGGGFDAISYPGSIGDYQISGQLSNGTVTVRHLASGKVDSLQEMESIIFSDRSITSGEPWFNQGTIWGSSSAENVVQTQFYDDPDQRNPWFNYNGGAGNDSISWTNGEITGGPGNDRLEALAENVRIRFDDSPNAVLIDLKAGYALDGWGGRDQLINIRQINGLTGYADTVIGSDQDDRFWSSDGGDTIDGGAGFDVLEFWAGGNRSNYYISYSDDFSFTLRWQYNPTSYIVLKNFEGVRINHPEPGQSASVLLTELINWSEQAPKALMNQQSARWNFAQPLGTPTEVSFSFMAAAPTYGSGGLGDGFQALNAEQQQQIRKLVADISKVSGLVLKEVPDAATSQIRIGSNQQNTSKAYSFSPDSAQGPLAGDIWLDIDTLASLMPGAEGYWISLQELGHALGLRKPIVYSQNSGQKLLPGQSMLTPAVNDMTQTVMSDVFGLTPNYPREFGVFDTLALQRIYGPPAKAIAPGNDVYRLDDLVGERILNLIDSGGVDRVDLSELSLGAMFDLRPSAGSSAGMSAKGFASLNNIQISPGTILEEVVGTRYDDVLIGNDANNLFYPGLGNDYIDGGEGLDTLVLEVSRSSTTISPALSQQSLWLTDNAGIKGSKQIQSIERVFFNDGMGIRFDFDQGSGRDAALLIGGFLGPQAVRDPAIFGLVASYLDSGGTLKSGIDLLVKSGFIAILTGKSGDNPTYDYVYRNTKGLAPSANTNAFSTNFQKQTEFIEALIESSDNAQRVNLIGLQQTGLEFMVG
jgi:Ca2+-binding RTX toxin-like protein